MHPRSKAQRRAAGAALSSKRGETAKDQLTGAALEMYESMSEKELEQLASIPRDGKPKRRAKK